MKRIIKLSLTVLVMITTFLVWPEQMNVLEVGAATETIDSDLANEDDILKIEKYLNEYSKGFPTDDSTTEKLNQKEYLTKKLEADHFTEEELIKFFEIMAKKRKEEIDKVAQSLLNMDSLLSKSAFILKLEANTYSQKEVEYGIESIDVDWKEQAVRASEQYINTEIKIEDELYLIMSRKCLLQFLVVEKNFTLEEVTYGVEESAIDWAEQSFKQAEYYLADDTYSKTRLIEQLIIDEFNSEEAEYGVTQTQTNWKEQAVKKSDSYLAHSLVQSKEDLVNFLRLEGFSDEETDYAVNLVFEDVDEELDVEEPSLSSSDILAPEKPVIIKPLETVASQVIISGPEVTDKSIDIKDLMFNKSSLTNAQKIRSPQKETTKVAESEKLEDAEQPEETSLFDSPIFAPVLIVLIVGNLYLFQRT